MPSLESLSIFGVSKNLWPLNPTSAHAMSSAMMKTMLGLSAAGERTADKASNEQVKICSFIAMHS